MRLVIRSQTLKVSQSYQNNQVTSIKKLLGVLTVFHFIMKLEYDIASDIRGLRENIRLTELKNFTIASSVFILVDNHL